MAEGKSIILDVRTPDEFAEAHLEQAKLIDFMAPDFASKVKELDPEASYKLYCRSGNRSGRAAALMQELGFKNVENVGSLEEAAARLGVPYERR